MSTGPSALPTVGAVRIAVLGEFRLELADRAIEIGPRMHRALLSLLAVEAGRVVSVERLIDSLWGERPPPAAMVTLQAYISQLRKVIEPERPARGAARILVTHDPGYVLRLSPDDVDVLRFQQLARAGHAAIAGGRFGEGLTVIDEAMGLWRGQPFADFAADGWPGGFAAHISEVRAVALEDRISALLGSDQPQLASVELETMVAEEPLRERRWAMLMTALYRTGRQAAALRAFQRCRTILDDELGIEPGPELRQLELAILSQDPGLSSTGPAATQAAHPVAPVELVGSLQADDEDARDALVAREAQVGRIAERLAQLRGSGGAIVLIGEPGVGKTSIAAWSADEARRQGARVVWSRCFDQAVAPPYWAWIQMFRELRAESLSAGADQRIESAVRRLSGGAGAAIDEASARFAIYADVRAALVEATTSIPVLIVIDDLHAADVSSLMLMQMIAGDLSRLRVLVVVTVRDTEPSAELAQTLAELARDRSVERIDVHGLGVDDVGRFVERRLGVPSTPELAAALHDRTGGNPFFLGELLRLFDSEHRGVTITAADVADVDVPAGVRDVLTRRVARLPEGTRRLLVLAAVAGRDVDFDVVEHAADLDSEAVMLALEPAVAAGLLVERTDSWGYRFTHPLVRDSIYADLGRVERARLHARLASTLDEVAGADPDRIADIANHHLAAGPLGNQRRAVETARQAAEAAGRRSAWTDAVRHLESALRTIDVSWNNAEPLRCDLLVDLGLAVRQTGDVVRSRTVVDEAIRLALTIGDPDRAMTAAVTLGHVAAWNAWAPDDLSVLTVQVLEQYLAAGHLGDDPDSNAQRARIYGAMAGETYYLDRDDDRTRYAEEAVRLARDVGDVELRGRSLNNFYLANWVPGREDRQLEAVEEALTLSGAGLPIGYEIVARIHRLACLQRLGRLTDFDVEIGRVGALADRLRVAEFSAQVALLQAGQATLRGDGDAARRHGDVGLELQRRTSIAGAEVNHFVCLSMVDRCHGADGDHADELYEAAQDPAKGTLRPLAILALAEAGRHDAAIALLDRWYTPPTRDWAATWITAHWALIATELGGPADGTLDAAMLYRCLAPGAEHLAAEGTGIVFGGSMHTILAGLAWRSGDHASALRHAELGIARDATLGLTSWRDRGRRLLERISSR